MCETNWPINVQRQFRHCYGSPDAKSKKRWWKRTKCPRAGWYKSSPCSRSIGSASFNCPEDHAKHILRYYPYKLQLVQELLAHNFETRHLFSLQFLARLEVDPEWPWNIIWTDEAHFHLDGSVNTHNCRIWESDNPHSTLQVPLHSPKVTVWCGFSTSFILGPYFFEELGAGGPVTCSITGQRYASLLGNKIFPDLQARQRLSRIIFMQNGAPPHITRCVKDVLKHHFTEERVISRQFLHLRPPRSPDLNPCDFWLWGHLRQMVSCHQPRTLPDLEDSISRHVLNISQNTLRSTLEHAILRFQIVA
ncbi:transposable element tc3 transposase [Trichonephila clavipes]|uniref:Transposable element tc3 transposase n=1 Tax=Trichonephila clavipes TaxID=2585209 RepID=A0A8X6SM58_TRICX|nr:transposable element tc3 transposase [Trichonephila clavipes]